MSNPIPGGQALKVDALGQENQGLKAELAAANERIIALKQQWKRLASW